MAEQVHSDDQEAWDATKLIIECLSKFDDDTRTRILRTVQAFFLNYSPDPKSGH